MGDFLEPSNRIIRDNLLKIIQIDYNSCANGMINVFVSRLAESSPVLTLGCRQLDAQ